MRLGPTSKTWKILSALLMCVLIVAAIGCLVHTETLDQAHGDHGAQADHRHPSASHLTLDLHCMIAILPVRLALVCSCLSVLYSLPLLSNPVAFVLPPFKPPKDVIYA